MSARIGRGWATVELDRAAAELAGLLEPDGAFTAARRSSVLGASCRVGRARLGESDTTWIVLLEPDSEGRLAGFLARAGEGWAAEWHVAPREAQEARGVAGPLGDERLVGGTPSGGPFRLLLAAATIER